MFGRHHRYSLTALFTLSTVFLFTIIIINPLKEIQNLDALVECEPGFELNLNLCLPCQPGTFSDPFQDGLESCNNCSVGTYSNNSAVSTCLACDLGTYAPRPGMTTCKKCPGGTFSSKSGSSTCDNCAPGTASGSVGSTSCEVCAAGSFSTSSASECIPCADGERSDAGASSCQFCEQGRFSVSGDGDCTFCESGTWSPLGASGCQQCVPGKFSSEGATACKRCDVGKYTNLGGASFCYDCPNQTYSLRGATQCKVCNVNRTDSLDLAACSRCGAGFIDKTRRQDTATCVPCPPRTWNRIESDYCITCKEGTYNLQEAATACLQCPQGKWSNMTNGASACFDCPSGRYSDQLGLNSIRGCLECPKAPKESMGANSCGAEHARSGLSPALVVGLATFSSILLIMTIFYFIRKTNKKSETDTPANMDGNVAGNQPQALLVNPKRRHSQKRASQTIFAQDLHNEGDHLHKSMILAYHDSSH